LPNAADLLDCRAAAPVDPGLRLRPNPPLRGVALIYLDTENAAALENSCLLAYIQHMRRNEVIAKLKETEPALRGFGVGALYLFGSHARDEAKSGSDVDVFVDPAPGRDLGFLPFMDVYATIRKAFGDAVEIGYSTRTGLSPDIVGDVEREAVRIF
jgi:predicted nucleotidyltransferase